MISAECLYFVQNQTVFSIATLKIALGQKIDRGQQIQKRMRIFYVLIIISKKIESCFNEFENAMAL